MKIRSVVLLGLTVAVTTTVLQFLYNFLFVKPYEPELIKGGDGKLTQLLYDSEWMSDDDFDDAEFISLQLEGAIERIDVREDCADFTANAMIRFYLENQHRLHELNKQEIKKCLTGFKYWMDQEDGRVDSMCHWSENHQILFAVTEYLAGMSWPEEVFADGKSGLEHMQMAKERIQAWMQQRFLYGFSEYYSNNYYPEDIGPMANFIQFAPKEDQMMVEQMKIIMDLILIDIATQSYRYVDENGNEQYAFMSASGRMYMDNKSSDDTGNRLRPYIQLILGNRDAVMSTTTNFFVCFRRMMEQTVDGKPLYEVPEILVEILKDDRQEQIIKSSNGITLEELVEDGLVGQSVGQIMMQTGMEAFTNSQVIDNSIAYLKKNNLFNNEFLNDFRLVNLWPLSLSHSYGLISNLLNPSTNGKAIQRANVYTYQTPYYSMSTNQEHFAGDYADQHQISLSTLSGNLTVHNAQPMRNSSRSQYWVGYGRLPYSVQEKNVNVSIYDIPSKKGFMEPHIVEYTHAYFPVGLFDEVKLDYLSEGYMFGRVHETYVMMHAMSDHDAVLMFKDDMDGISAEMMKEDRSEIKTKVRELIEASSDVRYDLIFTGGQQHAWITELSSVAQDGSFDAFIERVLSNECSFEQMQVKYTTNDLSFDVKYNEHFKVNGKVMDTEYARFENDYVENKIERKAECMTFSFHGKTLTLDFEKASRKQSK